MRYLAIAALAFSSAIFAANYVLPLAALPYLALCLVLFALASLRLRIRLWLRLRIIFFAAALGFGIFALNAAFTTVPASKLDGTERKIEARILDYPQVYDDYARVDIELTGDELPHIKGFLYDNELELLDAVPGERIVLTARLKAADTRYGKNYDHYNSRDIYFIASSLSNIEIYGKSFHLAALPALIRHAMLTKIEEVFPAESSAFMASLLLGEKSALYENIPLYIDLSRAGLMHVAAVSGMHIAFLVGLLQLLLGSGPKSSILCIALVWVFAFLTGAPASAVRAAFMQSLLLMAPVLRRENDPVTSLSAALALVLLFNPYAAASVSLQLSFGAMAGILCFAEPVTACMETLIPGNRLGRLLHYPLGILAVSLSVMIFTLPLCAVHFGYVSVLSPITNMLSLWAVSLCFMGGFICCMVGAVLPGLASLIALPVSLLARYIFFAAGLISELPFAVVYLSDRIMLLWLIFSYMCCIFIFLSRGRFALKLISSLALSAFMLAAALMSMRYGYRQGAGSIAAIDVGQGQSIAAISGDSCVVVDCGGGGKLERAGESMGAYLLTRGVYEIDALLLTHLHSDHANGLLHLMELVDVERIYMPSEPVDDDGLLLPILESARHHGTEIVFVREDETVSFQRLRLELFKPGNSGDANERCVACRIFIDDYDMLITADSPSSAERELIERHDIFDVDVLMVGHHGSRYSSCGDLLSSIGADTAIISAGYNSYGHPTHEVLERLDAYGYNIYRTDLHGTVEIRLG